MKTLVIAEHTEGILAGPTQRAASAARQIGGEIDLLLVGADCEDLARHAARIEGVTRVRVVQAPHYASQGVENVAMVVAQMAGCYTHMVFAASSFGKNLAPRVAAMIDVAMVSDIVEILDSDTFVRPIYAGNAMQTVQCLEPVKVLTVRNASFAPSPFRNEGIAAVEHAPIGPDMGVSKLIERVRSSSGRPDLNAARVVVAGGRGMGSRENFHRLLGPLADKLGAALGATRHAVDANFVSSELQVGQTGTVVAPDLYIAVGLSGAVQHLAGMRDARVIVAINKDPAAPIFTIADYALVGDLNEIVPQLIAALG